MVKKEQTISRVEKEGERFKNDVTVKQMEIEKVREKQMWLDEDCKNQVAEKDMLAKKNVEKDNDLKKAGTKID